MADLTPHALNVLEKRYLRKDESGIPMETVAGMFHRVAHHVAQAHTEPGAEHEALTAVYEGVMSRLEFLPNTPTFTGAGTPLGQLAACFVLPIDDDIGKDSKAGIFSTLRNAALIQQSGGGVGFSFSRLRHRGDRVQKSAGIASGPVSFLKVFDVSLSAVTRVMPEYQQPQASYAVGGTVIGASPPDLQLAGGIVEFMTVYNSAFSAIAQGGCLVPDTLVSTSSRGMMRLSELVDIKVPGWQPWKDDLMVVATDDGDRPSPRCFNNGPAETIRVTTASGMEIIGTPEHCVKIMTDDGPQWSRLCDLKSRDSVVFCMNTLPDNLPRQKLQPVSIEHFNEKKGIRLPQEIDNAVAFLIGYLHGNGFVGADGARFGFSVPHTSYLMTQLPNMLRDIFGDVTISVQQKPDDASVTFVINSTMLCRWLQTNDISKVESPTVSVPLLIRQSPRPVIAAYIAGLFEADGSVLHGYPSLSTTSGILVSDLQVLLLGLGCPNHKRTVTQFDPSHYGSKPIHYISLQSHVALVNWETHVAPHIDGRSRLANCRAANVEGPERTYVLPNPEWWLRGAFDASADPKLRKKVSRYLRGDRQLTEYARSNLADKFDTIRRYGRTPGNLWFSEVATVTPDGTSLTLDLEVCGNHTYIANGMVTHNTRRGASMGVLRVDHPDILEFISCKCNDQQVLSGFNISVGITDKFMEACRANTWFDLVSPRTGQVVSSMEARGLMERIAQCAHHSGEPGVLFLDTMNARNPLPHLYKIETTNPCVTGDTLIMTSSGTRCVRDLVGITFATHEGAHCPYGFYYKGYEPTYAVKMRSGRMLRCTADHRLMLSVGAWSRVSQIDIGTKLAVWNEPDDVVVSINPTGIRENVYDCTVNSTFHCYVSNGLFSHNCGEQALGPYENCCLGSINLAKHLVWHEAESLAIIDWEKLRCTIHTAVRFLDDVITVNRYVPAIPELREAAWKGRRIGLGYTGLADVLMACGCRYGSPNGLEMTAEITEFMQLHAMLASIDLAKERGPFPAIEGSIYDPKNVKWLPPNNFNALWDLVRQGLRAHGIRNAAVTTLAPTGTIGTVAGVEGYGIEPAFALSYTRRVTNGDGEPMMLKYASPLFARACALAGIAEDSEPYQQVLCCGSCQNVEGIPQHIKDVYVTAGDLTWKEHVDMQACAQRYLSNSVSKTINFPKTAKVEDVLEAYEYAWVQGCCGLTVYVTGSRDCAVLSIGK